MHVKKLSKHFKEAFIEVFSASSIHGIPNIIRTKRLKIKIIWALFFLSSFSLCSYLVIQSIFDYLQFEVITKIRKIKDFPNKFPQIIICNSNIFATNYSADYLNSIFNDSIYDLQNSALLNKKFGLDLNSLNLKIDFMKYLAQSYAFSYNLTTDEKRKLGHKIENFILSCKFAGDPCNLENFEWHYQFYNGNCYSFNSGRNIQGNKIDLRFSNKAGLYDGLQLEIFSGLPEYLGTFGINSGLIIYVQDQKNSFIPFKPYGLSISTGTETNVQLNKVVTKQLKTPYSDCELEVLNTDSSNSFLYQEFLKQGIPYTQFDCIELCYQYFTIKNCDCYDGSIPKLELFNVTQCLTLEQCICLYDEYAKFLRFNRDQCNDLCPLECESLRFDFVTTSFSYPIKSYSEILLKNPTIQSMLHASSFKLNHEELKKNILKLNIYYDSLDYVAITESPSLNLVTLLSNIGGTLGLFLGISVLSFIEILEVFLEVAFVLYEKLQKMSFISKF